MLSSTKLVAFALTVGFSILQSVNSSHESTTVENVQSRNKMSHHLIFEIKVHGFLLWASIGFLMPVSILVKRMSNIEESGTRLRIIFYVHAITQVIAVLIATVAAGFAIKYFDNAFNNYHQRIGAAFYVGMWLQAFLALFRPHRNTKFRRIWFVFHWLMGIGVSLLGIISIYTGLHAYHKRASKDVRVWTIIFTAEICLIVFYYILQEKWHYIQEQGTKERTSARRHQDKEVSLETA